MKRLKYLLFLILGGMMFFSCGKKEEIKEKAILNIADNGELSSLNSLVVTDPVSFTAIAALEEGLYQIDKDGKIIAGMAEKTDVSEDGKIYTFHIRDAKWSDGVEVTANDFVFAWRMLANPEVASEYASMLKIAGVKNADGVISGEKKLEELGIVAIDKKTLQVELEHPVPFFKSLLTFPSFYPIREDFYNAQGEKYGLTPENILSNGAFLMESWNQGSNYTMVKNPNYYDAKNVKIDGLNFKVIKDEQAGIVAYGQGDVDYIKLTGELAKEYQDNPECVQVADGGFTYIAFNQVRVPEFKNSNLRKAIALSYDKEQIAKYILQDGSIGANFAVPVKLATGPDGKDFREDNKEYLKTNKDEGRKYFELAKTELGKDKFTYEITFNDSEANKKIAEFLKSELESNLPGFTLTLKQVPFKERVRLIHARDFELGMTAWGPDYADPMTFLDMWTTNSKNNYGSWSNAGYDNLIENCSTGDLVNNPEKRWEAMKKAEEIIMNDAGIAPIYQRNSRALIKKNIKGLEFHSVGVNKVFKNAEITK